MSAKSNIYISIDGEVFNGWRSAARILCTNEQMLFMQAHRHRGEFVCKGRKIMVLHFAKVCNYERFNHLRERKNASKRRWREKNRERLKPLERAQNLDWCRRHRKERIEAQKRYIQRKREKEAQQNGNA